jgi:ribose transport system permease protein
VSAQPPQAAAGPDATAADVAVADPRAWRARRIRAEHIRDYGIIVVFIAIFIFLTFKSPVFFTRDNLLNLLYSNSGVGIAACAVTLVVIGGNFDLSLGGIFVLSGLLAAWVAVHWNIWLAFPTALLAGCALGLVNGLLITKLRVNAFLATLATSLVFFGIDKAVSGGLLITPGSTNNSTPHDAAIFTFLGQERLSVLGWDIQYPVVIFVIVAIICQILLARTVFGRHIYGIGGNPAAARLSGLKVDRVVITTFVIAGLAAGLAGLLEASAQGSGSPGDPTSQALALAAIAGVALGGTSIFGGVGAVWRTVIGVLILGLITNGFNLTGVPDFYQDIVRGTLIVLAVALGSMVERR